MVREPSKARAVTKGPASLRVILDWVSRICSVVLSKTFPSSHSGMKESDHPWRLFESLYTKEFEDVLSLSKGDGVKEWDDDRKNYTVTLPRVFAASTDYKDATNAFPM